MTGKTQSSREQKRELIMDFAETTIVGRIAAPPITLPAQVDTKSSGEVLKSSRTSFSVIVNRPWAKKGEKGDGKRDHDTYSCVMYGPAGEKVAKFLTQGKTVLVKGRPASYYIGAQTPDGKKQNGWTINVGPYGVIFGPDSQKVRTESQVDQNNAVNAAILAGIAAQGIDIDALRAAAIAALKAETKPTAAGAPAAAATGPEVDLPFGPDEGSEG
jgi:single-stranded DNA-binding protein